LTQFFSEQKIVMLTRTRTLTGEGYNRRRVVTELLEILEKNMWNLSNQQNAFNHAMAVKHNYRNSTPNTINLNNNAQNSATRALRRLVQQNNRTWTIPPTSNMYLYNTNNEASGANSNNNRPSTVRRQGRSVIKKIVPKRH
jgi:hypothetical protein